MKKKGMKNLQVPMAVRLERMEQKISRVLILVENSYRQMSQARSSSKNLDEAVDNLYRATRNLQETRLRSGK